MEVGTQVADYIVLFTKVKLLLVTATALQINMHGAPGNREEPIGS